LPPQLAAVTARLGFHTPTPVQEACLPPALAGESFLAVAPTGTGKTLAYLLPLWSKLPTRHGNLILVPARELGYQVSQMLQALDPRAREGIVLCLGGHDQDAQKKRLAGEWHTVIATPGRLVDNLESDPAMLRSIRFLVLDEFDRLIDMGFEEQVGKILAKVPKKRQTLLFSATGAEDALERLPLGALTRHHVQIGKSAPLSETFYFLKSNRHKNDILLEALKNIKGQALVFVGNREKANHLNGLLRLRGVSSGALHGDRLQSERALTYQGFKDAKFKVLVATDLAARGLDIPEVDLVVNFDLPRNFREYVHRSGRTARRSRPGTCLSFAGPDDYLALRNIEKEFGGPLPLHSDYAQGELWLKNAKRVHEAKVRQEKRAAFIREEQGLK
jgi:superfamily II DNA/RNA helicase